LLKRYLLSKSCAFGLNRLKTAAGNYGASQSFTTLNYSYDKIGNMTSKEGSTFVYGAGTAGPHAITSAGSDTITYDLNGNMLQHVGGGITRNFEYDIENRLKTYKHGTSTIATYAYDYSGQRIKKTVSQSGITTRFAGSLYEEDNTGVEYQHVFAGNTRVATIAPLGVKFYHGDHLGSRSVVTDSDGLEVDHIDYKPFGEINRHDAVASEEGHHFTDQYRDDETELYYYGARYYNPKVGRFITADWVVQAPGNSQSLNRYSYVLNNPLNLIDPTGNSACEFSSCLSDGLGNATLGNYFPSFSADDYKLSGALNGVFTGFKTLTAGSPQNFDATLAKYNESTIGQLNNAFLTAYAALETGVGFYQLGKGVLSGFNGLSSLKLLGNETGSAVVTAPKIQTGISTPYGLAVQSQKAEALSALNQVKSGATVYKGGVLGTSETTASQFLALENPLNVAYANRYGVPPQNANFNFILTGKVGQGAPIVTRLAPGFPPHSGKGIEAVVESGAFKLNSFYMP